MKTFFAIILVFLLLSCTSSSERIAWIVANQSANKSELTHFLDYYKTKNNRDKYKAACFLIENMPFYIYSSGEQLENYIRYRYCKSRLSHTVIGIFFLVKRKKSLFKEIYI